MPATSLNETLLLAVPDGSCRMDCHVSRTQTPDARPWVIVAMELFGVNDHIRDVANRVAVQGYNAIAPNFYHRSLPGASLPFGEDGRKQGFEHLHRLTRINALNDVEATIKWIQTQSDTRPRIACLGFSLGGHIAHLASTQFEIAACASFYGAGSPPLIFR